MYTLLRDVAGAMNSVLNDLASYAIKIIERHRLRLRDLLIGIKYAIAIVEGPKGVAAGLCFVDYLDSLFDPEVPSVNLSDLDSLLLSRYHLWRVAGVAIANAVFQYELWIEGVMERYQASNKLRYTTLEDLARELRDLQPVLIVGNMGPLIRKLRSLGIENLVVVERNVAMRVNALPDIAMPFIAKSVGAAIITGAAIPNGTLDYLLKTLDNVPLKVIVGPTAQADPMLFASYGIKVVASTRIIDISLAVDIVKRGGGRHALAKSLSDYIVSINTASTHLRNSSRLNAVWNSQSTLWV